MKKIKYFASLMLAATVGLTSCVDTDIEDVLDYDDHYKTETDADNAVLGAYSSFLRAAGQMVVLNELRGDLLDLTTNSSTALQEIDANNPSKGNEYADPTALYNVILNCNDAMDNFEKMYEGKRLTEIQFLERYSDLMALRCYVYLQLGAQYGKVYYMKEPIVSVGDIEAGAPVLSLDDLIPQLISDMTSVTVCGKPVLLEAYAESPLVTIEGIATSLDGYSMKYFFINRHFLLGDLYLWNNQYEEAAMQYKIVMNTNNEGDATSNYLYMKCAGTDTWGSATANSNSYYQIFFLRYMEDDANSYNNQWINIFSEQTNARRIPYEWAWTPSYDATFAPVYPFLELFAPTGMMDGGKYQLKPSDYVVEDLWGTQKMKNGFIIDGRGINPSGEGSSYGISAEGNYVNKYLAQMFANVSDMGVEPEGRLYLQRAGLLHLRYCEAVNRAGHPLLAYSLLNQGIGYSCNTYDRTGGALVLGDTVNLVQLSDDVQYAQPIDGCIGEPYYFAASETGTSNGSNPSIYGQRREPWRASRGVRGRVALLSKEASDLAAYPKTLAECTDRKDSIEVLEKIILDEVALECAFEGNRFPDLVRVARRMNSLEGGSGDIYFKNVMQGKYDRNGRANPYTTEESWYLRLKD